MTQLLPVVRRPPIDDEIPIVRHLETKNVIDTGNDVKDLLPATHLIDPLCHEVIPSLLTRWNVLIGRGRSRMDMFISRGVVDLIKMTRRT